MQTYSTLPRPRTKQAQTQWLKGPLIAIVLDKPLAEAKALVDDPAAFTREMTGILIAKQSHPLVAQMMRPAGSSDPPPANSTASGTGSHEHPSASQPVQFQ